MNYKKIVVLLLPLFFKSVVYASVTYDDISVPLAITYWRNNVVCKKIQWTNLSQQTERNQLPKINQNHYTQHLFCMHINLIYFT